MIMIARFVLKERISTILIVPEGETERVALALFEEANRSIDKASDSPLIANVEIDLQD